MLAKLFLCCKSKSTSHMLLAMRAWRCIALLMGSQIMALSKQILNPMLKMIEVVFLHVTTSQELAAATFGAWNGLIDAFEAAGQLSNPKRVALVAKTALHTLLVTGHPAILQEAISCWGHLISTVYCATASAASYAATDLVPPVLGKLKGSAEGLIRASGCKPSVGQAKAYDTPLPLQSGIQVLRIIQELQSPNVIALLAADVCRITLQPNETNGTALLPSFADVFLSWTQQLSKVDSQLLPQTCRELAKFWASMLPLLCTSTDASEADETKATGLGPILIQAALCANTLASTVTGSPQCKPVLGMEGSSSSQQHTERHLDVSGTVMRSSIFWSSIVETLISFREDRETSADHSSSNAVVMSHTVAAFKLAIWQAVAGRLNQMLPDPDADLSEPGEPGFGALWRSHEEAASWRKLLQQLLEAPFLIMSQCSLKVDQDTGLPDMATVCSTWTSIHAALWALLARVPSDSQGQQLESAPDVALALAECLRSSAQQTHDLPAQAAAVLPELALTALAALAPEVRDHHSVSVGDGNNDDKQLRAKFRACLLSSAGLHMLALCHGSQILEDGMRVGTHTAMVQRLAGLAGKLMQDIPDRDASQHGNSKGTWVPAEARSLRLMLACTIPLLQQASAAMSPAATTIWTTLVPFLRPALESTAASYPSEPQVSSQASSQTPHPPGSLPALLEALVAALKQPKGPIGAAAYAVASTVARGRPGLHLPKVQHFAPDETVYTKIATSTKKQKLLLPHQKEVAAKQKRGAGRDGISTYTNLDASQSQDAWALQNRMLVDSQAEPGPEMPMNLDQPQFRSAPTAARDCQSPDPDHAPPQQWDPNKPPEDVLHHQSAAALDSISPVAPITIPALHQNDAGPDLDTPRSFRGQATEQLSCSHSHGESDSPAEIDAANESVSHLLRTLHMTEMEPCSGPIVDCAATIEVASSAKPNPLPEEHCTPGSHSQHSHGATAFAKALEKKGTLTPRMRAFFEQQAQAEQEAAIQPTVTAAASSGQMQSPTTPVGSPTPSAGFTVPVRQAPAPTSHEGTASLPVHVGPHKPNTASAFAKASDGHRPPVHAAAVPNASSGQSDAAPRGVGHHEELLDSHHGPNAPSDSQVQELDLATQLPRSGSCIAQAGAQKGDVGPLGNYSMSWREALQNLRLEGMPVPELLALQQRILQVAGDITSALQTRH
ncbi:hypothetical protein WJX73_004271 [Symbiochloris irregularis]|uniref:Telomere-associated protein Rif1 N-terminal domain-containing protein n=1 Tax=Symbiochloris irregularis TaxID=706552 RepID=A0AAW1P3M0_9CHLO